MAAFEERGVQVLGASMDSAEIHARWRDTAINDGGIGAVKYPLLADTDKAMSNAYNVVHEDSGFSLRATFLIDKDGVVQHTVQNNLALGRDIDELLRITDALQFHEKVGEVCPANWRPGAAGMVATDDGVKAYLKDHAGEL